MPQHIAIRSSDGSWLVIPTKFDRQPGDAVVINNKKYLVITCGDKNLCISTMNFSINRNLQLRKEGKQIVYPEAKFNERNQL